MLPNSFSPEIDAAQSLLRPELVLLHDRSAEDINREIQALFNVNKALDEFVYGDMGEDDFLDILETNNIDVDSYLDIAIETFEPIIYLG